MCRAPAGTLIALARAHICVGCVCAAQYKAVDQECTPENICRNCNPWGSSNCFAVTEYPWYNITEYGKVTTAPHMAAEIVARGPIACGIDAGPLET